MNTKLLTAIGTSLIKNLGYELKLDSALGASTLIEFEKTSNAQEGEHLIIFELDGDPLQYIVAQKKDDDNFQQEIRKMLIETNVNSEITRVLNTFNFVN